MPMRVIRKILIKNAACILSFLIYYVLAIIDSITGHPWSAMDFTSGIVAMVVGFGIDFNLRRRK